MTLALLVEVVLLSVGLLYFYFRGQMWRAHTEAANRRRKRVEEDRAGTEKENADLRGLYDLRGDVLKTKGARLARLEELVMEERRTHYQLAKDLGDTSRKNAELSRAYEIEAAAVRSMRAELATTKEKLDRAQSLNQERQFKLDDWAVQARKLRGAIVALEFEASRAKARRAVSKKRATRRQDARA
jgi:chromosome segregation ATPase